MKGNWSQKINTSKTIVRNFLFNLMNYRRNKRSGRPPKLSVRRKRNIIGMTVKDCANSFTINYALQFSVTSITDRNVLKSVECLKFTKLKPNQNYKIIVFIKTKASSNVMKCNLYRKLGYTDENKNSTLME